MTNRVIWCLGMYASASTWLFNVVRRLSIESKSGEVQTYLASQADNVHLWKKPGQLSLVKSHEIREEATLLELAGLADKIFITIRDPRDAIASLMEYHSHDFDRALGLVEHSTNLCRGFAPDRRAKIFRYEDGFFEDAATVQTVAAELDYQLPAAVMQAIFDKLSRAEVDKYIATLPKRAGILQDRGSGDYLDPQTHWHSHHAQRTGKIGRWHEKLSPTQLKEIERRLPD